jgi:ABC-type bacteriocin/lantibiotic exporter with double-glycine peptidase domain
LIAKAPLIVPVRLRGYPHFVVFRGILGNRVLLADPAFGNRTMTVDRFERAWLVYPQLGRIGFAVARYDGVSSINELVPRADDFTFLR